MILDHINNLSVYVKHIPLLKELEEFIQKNPLDKLEITEKTRITDDIYIIPISGIQSPDAKKLLEAHRTFIDIHYSVSGNDCVVFKAVNKCHLIETPYQEADDYMLFKDPFEGQLTVPQGYFCLITPEIAHMAMCGNTQLTKFVFKVRQLID